MERTNLLARESHKNQAREFPTVPESGEDRSLAFTERAEEVPKDDSFNTGASNAERQLAPLTPQDYTLWEIDSTPTDALTQTIGVLRVLRDERLHDNLNSRPGLLLAQVALILERLGCGIPSTRESFLNLLRAARQAKPEETSVAP